MRLSHFLFIISILILPGCFSKQSPAPVSIHGADEGAGSAGVHTVSYGDTLYSISKRYQIAMRDIIVFNKLSAPYALEVGQRLNLPAPQTYKVRDGDNLYAVSRLFEVSQSELARLNNLRAPYTIQPGQSLRLPSLAQADFKALNDNKNLNRDGVNTTPSPSWKGASEPVQTAQAQARTRIPSETPARSSSKFLKPVNGRVLSSYGPKDGGLHNDGINIAAPRGTPVAVAENGVVVYAGNELKGYGNLVLVRHADRWMSAYAHLDSIQVSRGQTLKRGDILGTVGSTGSVDSPQLHFEIRRGTEAINPQLYLDI